MTEDTHRKWRASATGSGKPSLTGSGPLLSIGDDRLLPDGNHSPMVISSNS